MSKSHWDPRSRILISDSFEIINDKVKLALTDSVSGVSFDPKGRPGVSNLLAIMSYMDASRRTAKEIADTYKDMNLSSLKTEAASTIYEGLANIRKRYNNLIAADRTHYLEDIAVEGASKARILAEKTMSAVRHALGLR